MKIRLELVITIIVILVGAVSYIHLGFASSSRVDNLESRIIRIDNVTCAIAIELKAPEAKEICKR